MTVMMPELGDSAHELIEAARGLYESLRWLAIEEEMASWPSFYVTVPGRWPGFAPAYHFDAASNPWPAARLDLFLRRLGLTNADEPDVLPCYLLGGRRPGHSRILTSAPAAERADVLARVVRAAADQAADRRAATLAALYCDSHDEDLIAAFAACGGVRLPSWPDNVLTLTGRGFGDWLAALPSKQRSKERADMRKLAQGEVEFCVRPLAESDLDWIVPLEMGLYRKYGTDYHVDEARRLHQAYLGHLGEDAQLVVASRAGRRVGFASLIRHGDTVYVRQGGFDHDACAGLPVYFGALFHTTIDWAYSVGASQVDYSTSADVPKRQRGCVARTRTACVVPLTAAAREILLHCADVADHDSDG